MIKHNLTGKVTRDGTVAASDGRYYRLRAGDVACYKEGAIVEFKPSSGYALHVKRQEKRHLT
ncbi:MAG: hypothetical protein HYU56_05035 [Candidatus Aenigmarchaeota archaeon]|nr:hypothetical protein [Candidatus Aenigmarchaeota archaeon]